MKRLFAIILAIMLSWAMPVAAQTEIAAPVVEQIEAQGYSVTEVERTWLGRILITAHDATHLREVVLNRVTGQVLSDRAVNRHAILTP